MSPLNNALQSPHAASYGVAAFLTAALPTYLFAGVFQVEPVSFALVYAIITISSALVLMTTYAQAHAQATNKLLGIRQSLVQRARGSSSSASSAADDRARRVNTTNESLAFTFFVTNGIFLGAFLVLAFYVLPLLGSPYEYSVSSIGAALIAWQLATTVSK